MRNNVVKCGLKAIALLILLTHCTLAYAQTRVLTEPVFVSLRSNEVNLRTGPGMQYPIEWIYKRRDMPVKVVEEFDLWKKIEDWEGTSGWVHQRMISSRRYGLILQETDMMRTSDKDSKVIAIIRPDVVAKIISCTKNSSFCRVEAKGKHGFIPRETIWGLLPDEKI